MKLVEVQMEAMFDISNMNGSHAICCLHAGGLVFQQLYLWQYSFGPRLEYQTLISTYWRAFTDKGIC